MTIVHDLALLLVGAGTGSIFTALLMLAHEDKRRIEREARMRRWRT